jgi:hypothetical protein
MNDAGRSHADVGRQHDLPVLSRTRADLEVTPLELFFDLVFVFAVSQLSRHLLEHVTLRGAAETLVLLSAVFAVWYHMSWTATIVPIDQQAGANTSLAREYLKDRLDDPGPGGFGFSHRPLARRILKLLVASKR